MALAQGTGTTEGKFTEFLLSVTKPERLLRPDALGRYQRFDTNDYIDDKTKSVDVSLVVFEAEGGIATTLRIVAEIDTTCKVSHEMQHFNAVEKSKATSIRWVN